MTRLIIGCLFFLPYTYAVSQNHHVLLSIMSETEQQAYIKNALNTINEEYHDRRARLQGFLKSRSSLCSHEPNHTSCKTEPTSLSALEKIYSDKASNHALNLAQSQDWRYHITLSQLYFWFAIPLDSQLLKHEISLSNHHETFELIAKTIAGLKKYEVHCDRDLDIKLANCTLNTYPVIEYGGMYFKFINKKHIALGKQLLQQRNEMASQHEFYQYLAKSKLNTIESDGNLWLIRYYIEECQPIETFHYHPTSNRFQFQSFILGRQYCE